MRKRIIVFDMDGTLGYFAQISIFIKGFENYAGFELSQPHFNAMFDLYKEYLRPDLCSIFEYIIQKKEDGEIDRLCIYTNNQGPKSWVDRIRRYLEYKCHGLHFDNVIKAFKINGEVISPERTTGSKTYEDLVKCTRLPRDTHVCFIDDKTHKYMEHENVYYIKVKPYEHVLKPGEIIDRYIKSKMLPVENYSDFRKYMIMFFSNHNMRHKNKSDEDIKIDKIVTKQILKLIRQFEGF